MNPQRSEEWFKERLGRATASSFDKVMAVKTSEGYRDYKTELIIERLTGVPTESYTNSYMQWGIDNEPLARLNYMLKTGNKVEETGFHKHRTLMAGASPDGLIGKKKGLEVKCPKTSTHFYTLRTGKLPSKYIAQVQGQMFICGFDEVDFVSFDPRLPTNAQMIIINVKRDNAYIELLKQKLIAFLDELDDDLKFLKEYGHAVQPGDRSRAKTG